MLGQTHHKRILLIEDRENFSRTIQRWLTDEGYQVKVAKSYQEAISIFKREHFHIAIADIRLEDEDEQNEDGLKALNDLRNEDGKISMPCIVLSAYPTVDNILKATQDLGACNYIQKKPGYRRKLLKAIDKQFQSRIQINFNLEYDDSNMLIPEIASDIYWSSKKEPIIDLLIAQIKDLFGKLFFDAERLYISKINPGLTGAVIVRVRPTWRYGPGPSCIVKINRDDKVQTESQNYRRYVKKYLSNDVIAKLDEVYTQHVGALMYTFAERDGSPLDEFDTYYSEAESEGITNSLDRLFRKTCGYWYDQRKRVNKNLLKLYYKAFELTPEKLIERIRSILPHFKAASKHFHFENIPIALLNPVTWLKEHADECVLSVYYSVTHGDLTGRNILVDQDGRCWLIDFYRTYESHILRDFIILETDIKYRLMPKPSLQEFLLLEQTLLKPHQEEDDFHDVGKNVSPKIQKAFNVLKSLRILGRRFSQGVTGEFQETRKEYLISLLMGTLNVIRLRHIETGRKLQAMLSAVLICIELDHLAGRNTERPDFSKYLSLC